MEIPVYLAHASMTDIAHLRIEVFPELRPGRKMECAHTHGECSIRVLPFPKRVSMTDIHLTQADADALLQMEKHRANDDIYEYPGLGGALRIPLVSPDRRESFVLDITRSQINLGKGTYQGRARAVVILARLDFGGPPHRNPDLEVIPCPHLHVYREGFGDKWAHPLNPADFPNIGDRWLTLTDFLSFINVTLPPDIRRGLFT